MGGALELAWSSPSFLSPQENRMLEGCGEILKKNCRVLGFRGAGLIGKDFWILLMD